MTKGISVCCILLSLIIGALLVPSCLSFQASSWGTSSYHCHPLSCKKNSRMTRQPPRIISKLVVPKSISIAMTTTSESADDNADNMQEPHQQQKEQQNLTKAYKWTSALFGIMSVVLFCIPDKTLTKRLASKWGGAAGFGLAAYSSHILMGASQNNRLSSDTYKRCNLGILGFSVLGLAAVPGEAAFWPLATPAILTSVSMTCVKMVGAIVSYWGWKYGTSSSSSSSLISPTKELWEGWKSNLRGLRVVDKKKSLFYRNTLLIVLFSMFSNFMEGMSHLRYKEALTKTSFDISLQWSGVSRLFLISSILYSLKDAADRDRLSGTTFIHMNFMLSIWALLVCIGQCIVPYGFSVRNAETFVFSLMLFIKGVKGQKEKRDKKEATEET